MEKSGCGGGTKTRGQSEEPGLINLVPALFFIIDKTGANASGLERTANALTRWGLCVTLGRFRNAWS